MATTLADGEATPQPVTQLTLLDYAANQGADVTVVANNLGDTITSDDGTNTFTGGTGIDTVIENVPLQVSNFAFNGTSWLVGKTGTTDTLTGFEKVTDSGGHTFLLVGGGSQFATIQEAVNAAHDGDTILLAPGTYHENVVIDGKAVNIEGFGGANGVGGAVLDGSITQTGAIASNMTIEGLIIDATGQQDGISLSPTLAGPETVTINNVAVSGASQTGYILNGGGTNLTADVTNSSFSGNGFAKTATGGSGDITYFEFLGNANFTNVQVTGAANGTNLAHAGDNGIQIAGFDASNHNAVTNPLGDVTFENVSVTGTYAKTLVYIQGYDDASNLHFTGPGLTLGDATTQTGWTSMFVDLGPQGVTYVADPTQPASVDLAGVHLAGWSFVPGSATFAALAAAGYDDLIVGTPNTTDITGTPGNDAIVYNWTAGAVEHIDGGDGTDALFLNGTAAASTYNINPIDSTHLGISIDTGFISIGPQPVTTANAAITTTSVEEININLGNGGNAVLIDGNLHGVGVATSTVTVNGGTGHDIVGAYGITGTPVDVVFNGGGGGDLFLMGPGHDTFTDTGQGEARVDEVTLTTSQFSFSGGEWTVTHATGTATLKGVNLVDDDDGDRFLLVSPDSQYTTIQAAVNDAHAGDTILVAPGTYTEQVSVNGHGLDGISIVGLGTVTIDAPATLVSTGNSPTNGRDIDGLLTVSNASNVSVENIHFNGLQEGASVTGANNPTLVGIAYLNASGTVDHVDVTGIREGLAGFGDQRGLGIYVSNTAPAGGTPVNEFTLTNSTIEDFQKGGVVATNAIVDIEHDTVTGFGATGLTAQNGIQVAGSTGTVSDNTITNIGYTGGDDSTGILFFNDNNLTLNGNSVTGALTAGGQTVNDLGIAGFDSANITINGNQIVNVLEGIVGQEDGSGGLGTVLGPNWSVGTTNTVTNGSVGLDFEAFDPNTNALASADFTVTGTNSNDLFIGGSGTGTFSGAGGDDSFVYNVSSGGKEIIDGGDGTDTLTVNGTAATTYIINPLATDPTQLGIEVVAGANHTGTADAGNSSVTTTNVEEIVINLGSAGDTVDITGDLHGTGVATSTVTINGGTGNDTVNLSGLTGTPVDVVFHGGGGSDTLLLSDTTAPVTIVDSNLVDVTSVETIKAVTSGDINITLATNALNDVLSSGDELTVDVSAALGKLTLDAHAMTDASNDTATLKVLLGIDGNDVLTGGPGENIYQFGAPPTAGNDQINNFTSGKDEVAVSAAGFGGGLTAGEDVSAGGVFGSDATANFASPSERFHFDTANQTLYYSSTGAAATAIALAHIEAGGTVTAHDIHVVA